MLLARLVCIPWLTLAVSAGAAPHAWISSPLRAEQPHTRFTNLVDGQSIETPFVAKFGLSRYGLAPIVKPVAGTGHHHLLVNRELPLDFKQPLPFNEQYIHFGKGQMETVLNFPPGEYTLRLLLADDKHIPHFVYSAPLRVKVTRKHDAIDPKSLVRAGVGILAPAAGDSVKPPFRVVFHASGTNVGHAKVTEPGVGHFRLVAERSGAPAERIEFDNGATEAWIAPPPGSYRLRVELVRNAAPNDVMFSSDPLPLTVTK